MVGITTIAKVGGISIALMLGYTFLKNAGKIGSSVGGFVGEGFNSLGSGIADSFTSAFDIFGGSPSGQSAPNDTSVNTPIDDIIQSGGKVIPDPNEKGFKPISTVFKQFVESGNLSESFAQKYSFAPPSSNPQVLDVSNTFGYINRGEQSPENLARRQASNFGGYGNEQAQNNALARAIEQSATLYPEWFA